MIACDAIRLLAVGSIAVAGWAAHITYVQVLVAGFAEGTATVFFGVAQRAALPMLVHPSQRSVAVGQRKIPAGITITGCMWTWAILLALIVLVRVPLWLCPIVAVLGFVGPSWNVSVQTYRMQITPNKLLGRTSSVALQIAWGVIPLGSLLAG